MKPPNQNPEQTFLKTWIEGDAATSEILREMRMPEDSPLGKLLDLLDYTANAGRNEWSEVIRRNEGTLSLLSHRWSRLLLLANWSLHSSAIAGRVAEARSIAKRAADLVRQDDPYPIRTIPLLIESTIQDDLGNHRGSIEIDRAVAEKCPPGFPRRSRYIMNYAFNLCSWGRLKQAKPLLSSLKPQDLSPELRNLWNLPDFFDAVDRGDQEKAESLLGGLKALPWSNRGLKEGFQSNLAFLRLQQGREELPPIPIRAFPIQAIRFLSLGEPEQALADARKAEAANEAETVPYGISWAMACSELACRHPQAARRHIERMEAGSDHFLLHLLRARLGRLEGRREEAAGHFSRLLEEAREYDAERRLAFELQASCELTRRDLSDLYALSAAHGKKEERPTTPAAPPVSAKPSAARGAGQLIGSGRSMERLRALTIQLAGHDAPVLIVGETGSGKELVARALHEEGRRRNAPFLAINCSGIAESLLTSELFGHTRGAFTGAEKARKGLFEEAGEGTLFLDEIGDISPGLQIALLRALENREIRPLGGNHAKPIACRILAATHADLEDKVREGAFRKDLLFRLQRLVVSIPSLRDHLEDLPELVDHFLNQDRMEPSRAAFSQELLLALKSHPWPGNVRELKNVVERMRILNSDKLFYEAKDLDPKFGKTAKQGAVIPLLVEPAGSPEAFSPALRSPRRRLERIRQLFREHRVLAPRELKDLIKASRVALYKDLVKLQAEGFVQKLPHSHDYEIRVPRPS